uniref:Uncharacterized protein n=1 Tax=Arundo donax TaxID=35708 RepID=A0A0A9EW44_ARUDO
MEYEFDILAPGHMIVLIKQRLDRRVPRQKSKKLHIEKSAQYLLDPTRAQIYSHIIATPSTWITIRIELEIFLAHVLQLQDIIKNMYELKKILQLSCTHLG